MTSRRNFIRTCASAACFCGFSSFFRMYAQDTETAESHVIDKNEAFALQWITEILESLDKENLTEEQLRNIVKASATAHYDLLDIPEMVKPYIGNPVKFIEFLQNAWGWKVNVNNAERQLIVDENKPFCVCPLLKNSSGRLFPALCYCSEGFAEKMFSAVYGRPVNVVVAASVQRGDPSCIYQISY